MLNNSSSSSSLHSFISQSQSMKRPPELVSRYQSQSSILNGPIKQISSSPVTDDWTGRWRWCWRRRRILICKIFSSLTTAILGPIWANLKLSVRTKWVGKIFVAKIYELAFEFYDNKWRQRQRRRPTETTTTLIDSLVINSGRMQYHAWLK